MRPFQTNHAAIQYVFGLSYINNSNSHIPKTIDCLNLHFCIFHLHQFIPIGSMYGIIYMIIYTYIYHNNQANVSIYASPMDPMGLKFTIESVAGHVDFHKIRLFTGFQ